jgi:methylmalonyl-CoA/ethylmalonyl-CoA epimerase
MDHVAYSCVDIEKTVSLYTGLMGYMLDGHEDLPEEGIRVVFLKSAEEKSPKIELLFPLRGDSSISKSILKRGTGLHHVCFKVSDIKEGIKEAEQKGLSLLPGYPKKGSRNKDIAFFSPVETGGVLIEICS